MADYDVEALALASPPQSAPPATYTPAITARNNGLFDAVASGWLSVYRKSTGVLVAQFNVLSGTIHPGSSASASANGALDLSAEPVGTQFIVTGYVTTPNDQVEPNNSLAPVIVTISAEPPPPPPPVEAHHAQHEEGGADTISVEGLTGKLSDAQTPTEHATSHQLSGEDQLNVEGLSGHLAEAQDPTTHGNSAHTEQFLTSADIPNQGAAERWAPRVTEVDSGAEEVYYPQRAKPNIGGAIGYDYLDDALLHDDGSHTLLAPFSITIATGRKLELRWRAGLKIQGSQELHIIISIVVNGGGAPVIVGYEEITIPASSDQGAIIIEATANIRPDGTFEAYFMNASGFVLYPPKESDHGHRRFANYQAGGFSVPDVWTAEMTVTVLDGDEENGLYWYHGSIEHIPTPLT